MLPQHVRAAACCAGGGGFPSLILSDDQAQIRLSNAFAKVVGDAPDTGRPVFRSSSDNEWIQTNTLSGALLISEYWQIGISLPFQTRSHSSGKLSSSHTGLGDVSATIGYEVLPEFEYSYWKPRGFLFSQIVFPTGGNIYNADKFSMVDAHGRGFYSLSVGLFLVKNFNPWDTSFRYSLSKSLPRKFETQDGTQMTVNPTWDMSLSFGGGYNLSAIDWRFGLDINPIYTGPTNVSSYKLVWNTTLGISKIIKKFWMFNISYNDQTILGPAKNTSLERSALASIQYRWER